MSRFPEQDLAGMLRYRLLSATLFAVLLGASPVSAQDTEPAGTEAEAAEGASEGARPTEDGASPEEAATHQAVEAADATAPAPQPAATRQYARPRAPLPIMVVVLPGERVDEEATNVARAALLAQIEPMAAGRTVLPLGAEEMIGALAACEDDACIGGQLGSAGVMAGVILRLTRRGRQLDASLEIRDPVSGALRIEAPLEARLPRETEEMGGALAPMTAQLASAMPSAPPRNPSLLVTTTHDGALVTVDGEDIGESPVGPIEIADGTHEVMVRLAGFSSFRTETAITPGEWARVDASLTPLDGSASAGADGFGPGPTDEGEDDLLGQWWFWTAIGGGAAVLIVGAIVLGVVLSDQGAPPMQDPMGIPLPPIMGGM